MAPRNGAAALRWVSTLQPAPIPGCAPSSWWQCCLPRPPPPLHLPPSPLHCLELLQDPPFPPAPALQNPLELLLQQLVAVLTPRPPAPPSALQSSLELLLQQLGAVQAALRTDRGDQGAPFHLAHLMPGGGGQHTPAARPC